MVTSTVARAAKLGAALRRIERRDSIYFEDPLGLLIELASYRFEPPPGYTHADVLLEAHKLRVQRADYNIDQVHLADAIQALVERSKATLSDDRAPKDPYRGRE